MRESVRRKQPEKWRDGDWILHHDNAPAHTSHLVQQFLAKHGTAQFKQPPYSPDLAPCDFFLFPRLKKVLKGHRFETTEDIKGNSTKTLLDIPKEEIALAFYFHISITVHYTDQQMHNIYTYTYMYIYTHIIFCKYSYMFQCICNIFRES